MRVHFGKLVSYPESGAREFEIYVEGERVALAMSWGEGEFTVSVSSFEPKFDILDGVSLSSNFDHAKSAVRGYLSMV